MTPQEKYRIAVEALHSIASMEHCDCGCPHARKGRILRGIESFQFAYQALVKLDEPRFVMALDFTDPEPEPTDTKFRPRIPLNE